MPELRNRNFLKAKCKRISYKDTVVGREQLFRAWKTVWPKLVPRTLKFSRCRLDPLDRAKMSQQGFFRAGPMPGMSSSMQSGLKLYAGVCAEM